MAQMSFNMTPDRIEEITGEASGTLPEDDASIDMSDPSRYPKSGRKYHETKLDFGLGTLEDQAFDFLVDPKEFRVPGHSFPPSFKIVIPISVGVSVKTSGTWFRAAEIEGRYKAESATYGVAQTVSQETTDELAVGIHASATISAAPLGVGGEVTVGASLDYSRSITSGTSRTNSNSMTLNVDKGQGGQGWVRGGWLVVEARVQIEGPEVGELRPHYPANSDATKVNEFKGFVSAINGLKGGWHLPLDFKHVFPLQAQGMHNTYYDL
jgi:hypothetical protein